MTGSKNCILISEPTLLFLHCVPTSYKAVIYLLQHVCKSLYQPFYITLTMVCGVLLLTSLKVKEVHITEKHCGSNTISQVSYPFYCLLFSSSD